MYKMMIVEDELFVRIGLERAVNWAEHQIHLLPSASDGRKALELYEKYHPHLILTDIRMPEIGGLELISMIREQDKEVKFIVLSCLEDYQTVKDALNLAVSHYYNKSELDIAELTRYIDEVVEELSSSSVQDAPEAEEESGLATDREEWNGYFFSGKPCEFSRLLAAYEKPGRGYVLVRMDFGDPGETDFSFVQNVLEEILQNQKAGHCLAFSLERAVLLYVLERAGEEKQAYQMDTFLRHLELSMESYFNLPVAMASSLVFNSLGELPKRWEEIDAVRPAFPRGVECLSDGGGQLASRKVFAAIQYIREHLQDPLSLAEVAESVSFSPGYLSTLFRQELNISFSEFVLDARLRRVKLLLQGDASLSSIAEQTGFHDASYLIKVFKRATGMTPNKYRQQRGEKGGCGG